MFTMHCNIGLHTSGCFDFQKWMPIWQC